MFILHSPYYMSLQCLCHCKFISQVKIILLFMHKFVKSNKMIITISNTLIHSFEVFIFRLASSSRYLILFPYDPFENTFILISTLFLMHYTLVLSTIKCTAIIIFAFSSLSLMLRK